MIPTEPTIDFTAIEFPSDRLTIGALRRVWPDSYDVDRREDLSHEEHRRWYRRQSLDDTLGIPLIDYERALAERAFKAVVGQTIERGGRCDPQPRGEVGLEECLAETYQAYGLARGKHEVAEMLQDIIRQAEAQARQYGGLQR